MEGQKEIWKIFANKDNERRGEDMILHESNKQYDIPESILLQYEVKPKPTWDRMQCLRGEFDVRTLPIGGKYYGVYKDGSVFRGEYGMFGWAISPIVVARFPTRELAEEYLTIAEGKWRAKEGDVIYAINRRSNEVESSPVTMQCSVCEVHLRNYVYFPSPKQRDEYIAKHKHARPLAGKEAVIDGVKYILQ